MATLSLPLITVVRGTLFTRLAMTHTATAAEGMHTGKKKKKYPGNNPKPIILQKLPHRRPLQSHPENAFWMLNIGIYSWFHAVEMSLINDELTIFPELDPEPI